MDNKLGQTYPSPSLIRLYITKAILELTEKEIAERIKKKLQKNIKRRGYNKIYMEHVTQADKGVDFDFLI